jgi:hypothetical protein
MHYYISDESQPRNTNTQTPMAKSNMTFLALPLRHSSNDRLMHQQNTVRTAMSILLERSKCQYFVI